MVRLAKAILDGSKVQDISKATKFGPQSNMPLDFLGPCPESHVVWSEDQITIGPRHTLKMPADSWQLDSHFNSGTSG